MEKQDKCRLSQIGRVVVHKDNNEKRILESELQEYVEAGWVRGISLAHSQSLSSSHKNKDPWNKGKVGVMKPTSSSFKKGNEPWNKGQRGRQKAWNKGLTKETSDSVEAASRNLTLAWKDDSARRSAQRERMQKINATLSETQRRERTEKAQETKRIRNTLNTSEQENVFYSQLCEKYGQENVLRQYRDKVRYPFRCDFYIKSEDLFIELNAHWTHGGRPWNPDDPECQKQLAIWQEKAKVSKFYQEAILTWTVRDVKKAQTAKENNLNYKIVYSI